MMRIEMTEGQAGNVIMALGEVPALRDGLAKALCELEEAERNLSLEEGRQRQAEALVRDYGQKEGDNMKKGRCIGTYSLNVEKSCYIEVKIKTTRRFNFRWWLYLGLLKILSRICPFRTEFIIHTQPDGLMNQIKGFEKKAIK